MTSKPHNRHSGPAFEIREAIRVAYLGDTSQLNQALIELDSLEEQYNTALTLQIEARAQAIELKEQLEAAHGALEFIRAIQRTRLGWYRDQGVKFLSQPNGPPDPDEWESVAFWTYTDLCEAEATAAAVLNPASEPEGT